MAKGFHAIALEGEISSEAEAKKVVISEETAREEGMKTELLNNSGLPVYDKLAGKFTKLAWQLWRYQEENEPTEEDNHGKYLVAIFDCGGVQKVVPTQMFVREWTVRNEDRKTTTYHPMPTGGAADVLAKNSSLTKEGAIAAIFKGLKALGNGHFVVEQHDDFVYRNKPPMHRYTLNFVKD